MAVFKNSVNQIRGFWDAYESKIVIFFVLILISVLSFEYGFLQGKNQEKDVMIIEKPISGSNGIRHDDESDYSKNPDNLEKVEKTSIDSNSRKGECQYVGSKNSNKFYPPDCSYAKRIKSENIVCFQSADEAKRQGRTESSGCK